MRKATCICFIFRLLFFLGGLALLGVTYTFSVYSKDQGGGNGLFFWLGLISAMILFVLGLGTVLLEPSSSFLGKEEENDDLLRKEEEVL